MVEECLSSFAIGNEDKLFWPFVRGEVNGRPVRLFFCRDKAYVSRWNLD